MKLQTEKFGVDYWAMPAFNFADEKGYVPMAGAILTVRQLLQFIQNFLIQARVNQAQAQNE